jgi:hypothetical protein
MWCNAAARKPQPTSASGASARLRRSERPRDPPAERNWQGVLGRPRPGAEAGDAREAQPITPRRLMVVQYRQQLFVQRVSLGHLRLNCEPTFWRTLSMRSPKLS